MPRQVPSFVLCRRQILVSNSPGHSAYSIIEAKKVSKEDCILDTVQIGIDLDSVSSPFLKEIP